MKVMYLTGRHGGHIQRREVIRCTEHFVFLSSGNGRERREGKRTDYGCFFDTFEEAKEHLMMESEREISSLQFRLEAALKRLSMVAAMDDSP